MVDEKSAKNKPSEKRVCPPYMQNRELSWLTFDERCLEQGADPSVPLLERMQFVSIFWSNLQEFFMVRVGSLTDLSLLKKEILDNKTLMTTHEQLDAIYARCHELYPKQEAIYEDIRSQLAAKGIKELKYEELNAEQREFLDDYLEMNVTPFLSPQIINSRHPFPHLPNGDLYVVVRLDEQMKSKSEMTKEEKIAAKETKKQAKNLGADGVTMGLIPMPPHAKRQIVLPGEGTQYILLEDAIESIAPRVFSMYKVKHTNVICVTRNADLDTTEGAEETEVDYRAFMKKILKKRGRLAPVRLECKSKLSPVMEEFLLKHLGLKHHQVFVTSVPLDLGYVFGLPGMVDDPEKAGLVSPSFTPQWPGSINPNKPVLEQVCEKDVMLAYPYESMDAFVKLLQEAAVDPSVVSIKITLYRLASQSRLAEALISAAEHGKDVTALFELRARFDESNNIEWSQRFEAAGCNVLYGFHEYKTHSKICCITRQTENGMQFITQLGTGNYNEKTAKLYTDLSFITTDPAIGRDATAFFKNMSLENLSDEYTTLSVAPLQIKQGILQRINHQIALAKAGQPSGLFFKTNSVTDKDVIEKIVEASQAGVPTTMLVRGISCLVPGVPGYTENVRVVSIVGRLLEHSRIFAFGPADNLKYYLSSADLMTRNMDKRVEIAWPVTEGRLVDWITYYVKRSLQDTAKLRELKPDGTYTAIGELVKEGREPFNSQEHFIARARRNRAEAEVYEAQEAEQNDNYARIPMASATNGTAHSRTPQTKSSSEASESSDNDADPGPAGDDSEGHLTPARTVDDAVGQAGEPNAQADLQNGDFTAEAWIELALAQETAEAEAAKEQALRKAEAEVAEAEERSTATSEEIAEVEAEIEQAEAAASQEPEEAEAAAAEPEAETVDEASATTATEDAQAAEPTKMPEKEETEPTVEPAQEPSAATPDAEPQPSPIKKPGFFARLFGKR